MGLAVICKFHAFLFSAYSFGVFHICHHYFYYSKSSTKRLLHKIFFVALQGRERAETSTKNLSHEISHRNTRL
jgi:hypothetical protein